MKILFVHQNFPGQFVHLSPALVARGHDVLALTAENNARHSKVPVVRYQSPGKVVCDQPLAAPQMAIIAKGDEVLDWRGMAARYQQAQITLLEGGDHALSDFAAHLPSVAHFLQLA